jgi:hypothetical protein
VNADKLTWHHQLSFHNLNVKQEGPTVCRSVVRRRNFPPPLKGIRIPSFPLSNFKPGHLFITSQTFIHQIASTLIMAKLNVTILTTGNSACGHAARLIKDDIANVTLWAHPDHATVLNAVKEKGLRTTGEFTGTFRPRKCTTDLGDAIKDADLVIYEGPVNAQDETLRSLKEFDLTDIALGAIHALGFTGVAINLFESNNTPRIIYDINTSLDACRVTKSGPDAGSVVMVEPKAELKVCDTYLGKGDAGSRKTDRAMLHAVLPVKNIVWIDHWLHLLLYSSAHILHVVPSLHNLSALSEEKLRASTDYYPDLVGNNYAANLMMARDEERLAIAKAFGYRVNSLLQGVSADRGTPYTSMVDYGKDRPMGAAFLPAFDGNYTRQELLTNYVPLIQLGHILDLRVDYYKADMLNFTSAVGENLEEFMKSGRTLDKMGMAGMTKETLVATFGSKRN